MSSPRARMLLVVGRFKWVHIDYVRALGEHFDVFVAWSGEGGIGAPADAIREGMRGAPIGRIQEVGADEVRANLARVVDEWQPDVVHLMYYNHEELTLMAREIVGESTRIVFECRDPLTTLRGAEPGSGPWELEAAALAASDAQVVVSRAMLEYYEAGHDLDLSETALVIPHGFARRCVAPPSPKLSAQDGRVHLALVGTADAEPDHGRWYGDIIRRLVDAGFVVHSHFFELDGVSLDAYKQLARELDDYHEHPTVPHRLGTGLSELTSRYDLMGVFHELAATNHNESATLALCMPTKAVSGWLHGGIPVVCLPHYRGVVERIEDFDIGFVIDDWDELGGIAADREAIAGMTERVLAMRDHFTCERNAERVAQLVGRLELAS
jgi:hypothetical protein